MSAERWVEKSLVIVIMLFIIFAGFGQAVLQLWNWLIPSIFGLPEITYWQAVGLMGLSWILFGGLRGLGFLDNRSRGWSERRERMTPDERQRFREGLRAIGRDRNC